MSKVRISMRNLKNILYMSLVEHSSIRKISIRTGIPYTTVYDNINLIRAKGLTWAQVEAMSEETLEDVLSQSDKQRPLPDLAYIEKELKRPGVTLQLLWQEYKEAQPEGYQYSRFCQMYEAWCKKNDVYTPMPHKAGEELFVDYSGDKLSYICLETNQPQVAEIFVAVLGASDRIYAEASRSQELPCWIESNMNAFEYNEGVTKLLVPDNLKSGVTTPDRYEACINRTYEEMANHYGAFVVPARVAKAKDKSKAELGVQAVQREILAPLRNQTFFGLHALNQRIWERLRELNNRPFQKRPGSRESYYQEIEKAHLKPLPATRYSYREWITKLTVGQDHHVLVHGHSYSVPFQYARMEVEAAVDINMVEIFQRGENVARHRRSFTKGERTTLRDHMPPKYQHYFDSYDREKLLGKARGIGEKTLKWVEVVLSLKGRPPQTQCRTIQGALSLAKEYGVDRLEAICERALLLNIHSYKTLRSMLIKGAERLPLSLERVVDSHLPQNHANVRGADYFS